MGGYRVVEEIALADCALDIEGSDLDDLFQTAADALVHVMVDPATVDMSVVRSIALEGDALDLLLYDWLSELIFLKDRDRQVFPRVAVHVRGSGPFHLNAEMVGGVIDPERTALRSDPKAVTFHQFALETGGDGWRARVVIDI